MGSLLDRVLHCSSFIHGLLLGDFPRRSDCLSWLGYTLRICLFTGLILTQTFMFLYPRALAQASPTAWKTLLSLPLLVNSFKLLSGPFPEPSLYPLWTVTGARLCLPLRWYSSVIIVVNLFFMTQVAYWLSFAWRRPPPILPRQSPELNMASVPERCSAWPCGELEQEQGIRGERTGPEGWGQGRMGLRWSGDWAGALRSGLLLGGVLFLLLLLLALLQISLSHTPSLLSPALPFLHPCRSLWETERFFFPPRKICSLQAPPPSPWLQPLFSQPRQYRTNTCL